MNSKMVKAVLVQMIGGLMAICSLFTYNPFAVAYFSGIYAKKCYRMVTIPIMFGALAMSQGIMEAAKYGLIMITAAVVIGLFELANEKLSIYVYATITAISMVCIEMTDTVMGKITLSNIMISLGLGGMVFALSLIFSQGIEAIMESSKERAYSNEEMISFAIITGVILYSIGQSSTFPAEIAKMCAYLAVTVAGYKYGAGFGAMTGVACGIVAMSQSIDNINMVAVFSLMGIASGTFRKVGRAGSIIGATSIFMLMGFTGVESLVAESNIKGILLSMGIFLILPRNVVFIYESKRELLKPGLAYADMMGEERLSGIAASFARLARCLDYTTPVEYGDKNSKSAMIFEEVSEKMCQDCSKCAKCWKGKNENMYEQTMQLIEKAEAEGAVTLESVPDEFTDSCINVDKFLLEINHVCERNRLNSIWRSRILENKEVISEQLKEMAMIVEDCQKEIYSMLPINEDKEKKLRIKLKAKRIILKKIVALEDRNGMKEYIITARSEKGCTVPIKDLTTTVSSIFGDRVRMREDYRKHVGNEYITYDLIEDRNFYVINGTARKSKNEDAYSGDNFAFLEMNCGQTLMSISDGMGSGKLAGKESEMVIELIEQMLEGGFSEEVTLKFINSMMLINSESVNPATIDMGLLDLYSGVCDFIKLGAAATFIKRGDWVEVIKSTSLPAGVVNDNNFDSVSKKLYDGDFVIMVSDGILDSISDEDKEKALSQMIMNIDSNKPKEIAKRLLEMASGDSQMNYSDDKTVLVTGIWENCA